jgi:hypothetical protein
MSMPIRFSGALPVIGTAADIEALRREVLSMANVNNHVMHREDTWSGTPTQETWAFYVGEDGEHADRRTDYASTVLIPRLRGLLRDGKGVLATDLWRWFFQKSPREDVEQYFRELLPPSVFQHRSERPETTTA